jgi:CRISPR-associated Csh1 family protein
MLQALRTIGLAEVVRKAGDKATPALFQDAKAMARFREENMTLFAEWMALREAGKVRVFLITDEDGGRIVPADYRSDEYFIYLLGDTSGNRPSFPSPSWPHSGNAENMLSLLHKTLDRLSDDPIIQKLRVIVATLTPGLGNQPKQKKKTYKSINTEGVDINKNLLAHLRNPPPMTVQQKKERWKTIYSFMIDGKYPIDSPSVVRGFIEDRQRSLKEHSKTTVTGHGNCSLCELNGPVTGNAVPFNFYVLDKTTYFPETLKEASWKVNPICFTCADLLEIGNRLITREFDLRLGPYKCMVIPSLLEPGDTKENMEHWLGRFQKIVQEGIDKVDAGKAGMERRLSVKLGELGVLGTYSFLIYQQPQPAQFEVIRQIDDVLPSRISEVARAIDEVNQVFYKHPVFGNDRDSLLSLSFAFLTSVLGKNTAHMSQNERTFRKRKNEYFPKEISVPDLLYRIFTKHAVPWNAIVREFSEKLAHHYRDQKITNPQSFLLREIGHMMQVIDLFRKLEVLNMPEAHQVIKLESGNQALDDFVNQDGSLLSDPQRQVCFLTGLLFGKAEEVQKWKREMKPNVKAPIHKWLKGLNIAERDLRNIFSLSFKKLGEYDAHYETVKEIYKVTDSLWNRTAPWQLRKDEIRFFFTMGWTAYDRFLPIPQRQPSTISN